MSEMEYYAKYAELKSEITGLLKEFIKVCESQERDAKEEIDDCIYDAGLTF